MDSPGTLADLNRSFGIAGVAQIVEGNGGLAKVHVTTAKPAPPRWQREFPYDGRLESVGAEGAVLVRSGRCGMDADGLCRDLQRVGLCCRCRAGSRTPNESNHPNR
jgi:hypothetical protein